MTPIENTDDHDTTAETLLTAKQVASQLSISEKTVYAYVSKGLMPFIKIQTNVRFRADAIRQWVAQKEYAPPEMVQRRTRKAA